MIRTAISWLQVRALPIVGALLALSVIGNAVLGHMLKSSWNDNGALKASLEFQKDETVEAVTANTRLAAQIDELVASKQNLIDQLANAEANTVEALASRDRRIQEISAQSVEERRRWNEIINQKPECEAFLRGTIGDYCPDVAERVRERSRGFTAGLRDESS